MDWNCGPTLASFLSKSNKELWNLYIRRMAPCALPALFTKNMDQLLIAVIGRLIQINGLTEPEARKLAAESIANVQETMMTNVHGPLIPVDVFGYMVARCTYRGLVCKRV